MEGFIEIDEPPRVYKLQRLAFGVNCSPFLAIATVQSHAEKCSKEFHDASREVLSNMYVDDCLGGADDVEATVKLQQSLDKMMERGGFNMTTVLCKSNANEIRRISFFVLANFQAKFRAKSFTAKQYFERNFKDIYHLICQKDK